MQTSSCFLRVKTAYSSKVLYHAVFDIWESRCCKSFKKKSAVRLEGGNRSMKVNGMWFQLLQRNLLSLRGKKCLETMLKWQSIFLLILQPVSGFPYLSGGSELPLHELLLSGMISIFAVFLICFNTVRQMTPNDCSLLDLFTIISKVP